MANVQVTLDLSEDEVKTIDQIAANLGTDRSGALRDMVEFYLEDYEAEKQMLAEADRQIEAEQTISHEEVLAELERWKQEKLRQKEAA